MYQIKSEFKKFIVLLKFLNKIIKRKANANSTLAKPRIRKLNVNKFKSSDIKLKRIVKQYKIIQIISEYTNKKRKLNGFIINIKNVNQNKNNQKLSQLCILC